MPRAEVVLMVWTTSTCVPSAVIVAVPPVRFSALRCCEELKVTAPLASMVSPGAPIDASESNVNVPLLTFSVSPPAPVSNAIG